MVPKAPAPDEMHERGPGAPSWPDAESLARASAFLDLWERQVSERARLGPEGCASGGSGAGGEASQRVGA